MAVPILRPGVVIDRLTAADAPELARSHSDSDNARFQGWRSPLSQEASRFIDGQAEVEPLVPGAAVQLAIRESDVGPLAGDIYIDRTLATPWSVEVGITLVPGLRGRGIATAAI